LESEAPGADPGVTPSTKKLSSNLLRLAFGACAVLASSPYYSTVSSLRSGRAPTAGARYGLKTAS